MKTRQAAFLFATTALALFTVGLACSTQERCNVPMLPLGTPDQLTAAPGDFPTYILFAPARCEEPPSVREGQLILLTGKGSRRLGTAAGGACSSVPDGGFGSASPGSCATVDVKAFYQDLTGAAAKDGIVADLGEGICHQASAVYVSLSDYRTATADPTADGATVQINDWGRADRMVGIISTELAKWDLAEKVGLVVRREHIGCM